MDVHQLLANKETLYGISLDPADPFLERNLARLEMRFAERYEGSLKKKQKDGSRANLPTKLFSAHWRRTKNGWKPCAGSVSCLRRCLKA